jgi:hypothetical protein
MMKNGEEGIAIGNALWRFQLAEAGTGVLAEAVAGMVAAASEEDLAEDLAEEGQEAVSGDSAAEGREAEDLGGSGEVYEAIMWR